MGKGIRGKDENEAQVFAERIMSECKSSGSKFVDQEFVCGNSSLFYSEANQGRTDGIEWKRPCEITEGPELFVEGVESGDVIQGALGDCYFLGALAVIATRKDLLLPLFVGSYPEFGFHQIKFFKDGWWQIVTIDDQLPIKNGKLVYGRCKDVEEMWVPLMEKAYAKLHGCYEVIESGSIAVALTDLTGEACQTFDFNVGTANLNKVVQERFLSGEVWKDLLYYTKEEYMMGCSRTEKNALAEEDTGKGILKNHAYSVLECREPVPGLRMMKIRNPWGKLEWSGRYADNSPDWTPDLISKLNAVFEDDGTFWMCLEDFLDQFNHFIVLRLLTDVVGDKWFVNAFDGEFSGERTGGNTDNAGWYNSPQYFLKGKDGNASGTTNLFISLSQPDSRMKWEKIYSIPLGFYVMENSLPNRRKYSFKREEVVGIVTFMPSRDVATEVTIENDKNYVVCPCTYFQGQETKFWLTIYSQKEVEMNEIQPLQESIVQGQWIGDSAAGCINNPSWNLNPVFVITPKSTPTEGQYLNCTVKQIASDGNLFFVGMYAGKFGGQRPQRTEIKYVAQCTNLKEATLEVPLVPESDWPLFLMPITFEPKQERPFELTVRSDVPMTVETV